MTGSLYPIWLIYFTGDNQVNMTESECVGSCNDFDFVRFTFSDLHGIARSKSVPRKNVKKYLLEGVPFSIVSLTTSPTCDIILDFEKLGPRLNWRECGNMYCKPATDKIVPLPWAGGKYKVGEVLCECFWPDGSYQEANPRTVARRQLERLSDLGYSMYSAYEAEFVVAKTDDVTKMIYDRNECFTSQVLAEVEPFVYDLMENLRKTDIDIEYIHPELGPGQLELTGTPKFGIEAADMQFRMKCAVKEISHINGYMASFMGKPYDNKSMSTISALHFNHSLWLPHPENKGKLINAFHDPDGLNGLSKLALHWIAGLCKHARAITALCCPTVNCYRRLHQIGTPNVADWGYQDKMASFRAQSVSASATFVESRLPAGSCNPYLTFAATIAAGVDGIRNQLECPPMADKEAAKIPSTLQEALNALKEDKVISEALGEQFMDWFVPAKELLEIKKFSDHNPVWDDAGHIAAEREEYFKLL